MSRFTFSNEKHTAVFGDDHATGPFFQLWKSGEEEPLVSVDGLFDGYSHDRMREFAERAMSPAAADLLVTALWRDFRRVAVRDPRDQYSLR